MPAQALDETELKERRKHAAAWMKFRKKYLFTQLKLAEELHIARRTVQLVEHARTSPSFRTQRAFRDFSRRFIRDYGEAA